MNIDKMYQVISNPIDNPLIVRELIKVFSKSSGGLNGFYSELVKTTNKPDHGRYYVADADMYYSRMFNLWKNNIVNMRQEEYIQLLRRGRVASDFVVLRNYLKTVPDVRTRQEANSIFLKKFDDQILEQAMDRYKYTALGEGSSWNHIAYSFLTTGKRRSESIDHRLYINVDSLDLYKFLTSLSEECEKENMSYYYKFDSFADRDDSVVIYASDAQLPKYIDILRKIKREHPEFTSKMGRPPILTGVIDGWIGYGTEPEEDLDGSKRSFNMVRAKWIEPIIKKHTYTWILKHLDDKVTYKNKKMTVKEFLSQNATNYFLESLEKNVTPRGKFLTKEVLENTYGYNRELIAKDSTRQVIYDTINSNMPSMLKRASNGTFDGIKVKFQIGKKTQQFGLSTLEKQVRDFSYLISMVDPRFVNDIQKELKESAIDFGIDPENTAFDMSVSRNFLSNNGTLTKTGVSKLIGLDRLNKKIQLPNGKSVIARKYLEEVVFPHIPENGVVILANGSVMSATDFIVKNALNDCPSRYNSDFINYLINIVDYNTGYITLKDKKGDVTFKADTIADYVNPKSLNGTVTLKTGAEYTIRDFLNSHYSSYIPSNGKVILLTGEELPVTEYIESILLPLLKQHKGLDPLEVIFKTTRANHGVIETNPKIVSQRLAQTKEEIQAFKDKQTPLIF